MNVKAPPYKALALHFSSERSPGFDESDKKAFLEMWLDAWPAYREVLEQLFSDYSYENLLATNQARVAVEKLIANKKTNRGANLLLRFSFDDSGITWDIFQKDNTIVRAQPAF